MTKAARSTAPPKRLWLISFPVLLLLSGLAGGLIGLGGFTFTYAKGGSYLTDDPAACANCHVMREVYNAWSRGSHRNAAGCNDCHTPHDNLLEKYGVKAINGFNHSWAFTTGKFPEPIKITDMNRYVTQNSCTSCHQTAVSLIAHDATGQETDCLHCHDRVGHDEQKP